MFKLYDSSVGQRDAWGNQAIKVDARVEDEWDSIYVDCQDSTDVEYQDFSSYDSSGDPSGDGSSGGVFSSIDGGIQGVATDRGTGNARSPGSAAAAPAQSRREGESWRASSSSSSSGGSRSALMAAMDAYQAAVEGEEDKEGEEEERGGGSKGFDEEDIIDCAIRGRWTFKNDHDPVRGGHFFLACLVGDALLLLYSLCETSRFQISASKYCVFVQSGYTLLFTSVGVALSRIFALKERREQFQHGTIHDGALGPVLINVYTSTGRSSAWWRC